MTTLQARIIAVGCWLVTVACSIAFLAMWDEYTAYRDAPRATATVTKIAPYSKKHVEATLGYATPAGEKREMRTWPEIGAGTQVGDTVELAVSRRGVKRVDAIAGDRPPLALVPGAIAGLVLGVWIWLSPRRERLRRAARTSPLDIFIDGARRTRNTAIGAVAMFVVFAGFFAVVLAADGDATSTERIVVAALIGCCALVALVFGRKALQLRDPRNNTLVDLVENHPHDIVQFWIVETRVKNAGTVLDAQIKTAQGKTEQMRLVPEDADLVMAELARRAPQAKRGYTGATSAPS